jgi:hypothetical protein
LAGRLSRFRASEASRLMLGWTGRRSGINHQQVRRARFARRRRFASGGGWRHLSRRGPS